MESKNLILAFALSMGVLLGWGWIFPPTQAPATNAEQAQLTADSAPTSTNQTTSSQFTQVTTATDDKEVFTSEEVGTFANDVLSLSINAKGWVSNTTLTNYQLSLEDKTKVELLTMGEFHEAYIKSGVRGKKLVTPFKLVSVNESGDTTTAVFEGGIDGGIQWIRTYTLSQGSYVVNVKDRLVGGAGHKLYRQVVEKNPIESATANYNEHIGPIGLFQDKLNEVSYDDLNESGQQVIAAVGGWTGMMSRYFISAIYGTDQSESYRYYYKGDGRSYQAGLINDGIVDNGDMLFDNTMYIGPKSVPLLETTNVGLERSVDFGWFTVIAEPLHDVMLWLHQYISNFGVIIILMVITIKAILFIPTQGAYRSMAAMRKLQPEMARLKERYGDDRTKMGQEVMGMYKKNKVNPLGGCLPILMQMPVFFALYKVLLISIELRQAPFFGWIEDMSVQDPFFILPILMGISMYIQMQLNPQPTDPVQATVMKFLPFMMTALFLFFPAGLVLYWVVNNVLSIIQQRMVMKSMNVD